MVTEIDIALLRALIERLSTTEPIPDEEIEKLRARRSINWFTFPSEEEIAAHKERYRPKALSFLSEPGAQDYLNDIQNNISVQIKIVDGMFSDWLALGERPAPHYPNRICVILRKAKAFGLELAFLKAYCKHFNASQQPIGVTGEKLLARAIKIGALSPTK